MNESPQEGTTNTDVTEEERQEKIRKINELLGVIGK